MERERNGEKMSKQKRDRNLLALTGATAIIVLTVNFAITAFKKRHKKKDLQGSNIRVNLSAAEILKIADRIIAKSKEVHDAVASVPLDKVTYMNVISPLTELEEQQLVCQSCVFPKLVSTSDDMRKASAEAERRIDAHVLYCSKREDVYCVIKAVAAKGEWMSPETIRYIQSLVRHFEWNGLNLTVTRREELHRLGVQMDKLSLQYVRNLNDDSTFLRFNGSDLVGLPTEFLCV